MNPVLPQILSDAHRAFPWASTVDFDSRSASRHAPRGVATATTPAPAPIGFSVSSTRPMKRPLTDQREEVVESWAGTPDELVTVDRFAHSPGRAYGAHPAITIVTPKIAERAATTAGP